MAEGIFWLEDGGRPVLVHGRLDEISVSDLQELQRQFPDLEATIDWETGEVICTVSPETMWALCPPVD